MDLNEPSDEELRLVKAFQKDYPGHLRFTVQPKVITYSASWNNCIRNSSGKYLTVWSIDDLRTDDSIERQIDVLEQNPSIDIVYGKYKLVPRFGEKEEGFYLLNNPEPHKDATLRFIYGPYYMFRRELLERAGMLDEQFRSSADFDHCIRLSLHGKSAWVGENLGYYTAAGQGLSNNPDSTINVENFVIRMRYGIYNKLWYRYLPAASQYDYHKILNGNDWIPVAKYVPNYQKMLDERYSKLFDIGYLRHLAFKLKKENWSGINGILKGLH
jgi:hypothetical protein